MNFNDVKLAVKLVMKAGRVPMIQGERGIGKSTLVKEIAKEQKMTYINIDMNLCKEGELGGLPISQDRLSSSGKVIGKKTTYAPYYKILQALNETRKGNDVLLFLDELNRCEPAVIQEAMNLILNREINGLELPDNCYLVGAMNPPGSNENGDVNYQVTEMDAAAMDRFIFLSLDSNTKQWLDWATMSVNIKPDEDDDEEKVVDDLKEGNKTQFIHPKIVEFISQNVGVLNVQPTELNPITPSPRSWEMLSDVLYVYDNNKNKVPEIILYEIAKGSIGSSVATDLLRFIKDDSNPLIKPDEFFKLNSDEITKIVSSETANRQFLLFKNLLSFLNDRSKVTNKMYNLYIDGISALPKDIMVSIMKTTKTNYPKIHKVCTNNETYLDLFVDMVNYIK